jgi:hypothetical protein
MKLLRLGALVAAAAALEQVMEVEEMTSLRYISAAHGVGLHVFPS